MLIAPVRACLHGLKFSTAVQQKTQIYVPYLSFLASLGDSNDDDGDHHGDGERFFIVQLSHK